MRFWCEVRHECVSDTYEIQAKTEGEARKLAFDKMGDGDIFAVSDGDVNPLTPDNNYQDFFHIDRDRCLIYDRLNRGNWVVDGDGNEMFDENFWAWESIPEENLLSGKDEDDE